MPTATKAKKAAPKKAPRMLPAAEEVLVEEATRPLRVAYIGNFEPRHSTESHIARAMEYNNVEVLRIQENVVDHWHSNELEDAILRGDADFVLWTRTGWDWPHYNITHSQAHALQRGMLRLCRRNHVPVIGYHLDRWWGLARQHQVVEEPFFEVDLLVTADGGHDDDWKAANVNHVWFPPGVSRDECEPGMFQDRFFSQLAFVGSWRGGYHPEHSHRAELITFLKQNFRNVTNFWPEEGQPAIRNEDLRDLYASTKVNIGDSCSLQGTPRYCSDRIPETLGRGGLLIHPRTDGVTDGEAWAYGPMWAEDEHLLCWEQGNWDELGEKIDWALDHPETCKQIAREGREFTLQWHTYEARMSDLISHLRTEKLLTR